MPGRVGFGNPVTSPPGEPKVEPGMDDLEISASSPKTNIAHVARSCGTYTATTRPTRPSRTGTRYGPG